jgi:monoamine oxidase
LNKTVRPIELNSCFDLNEKAGPKGRTMPTRRQVLERFAHGLLYSEVLSLLPLFNSAAGWAGTGPQETTWDCIVIGAGMAGITAARDLTAAGFRVLILEASGRIGGRVCTVNDFTNGGPIELGAEYVHAPPGHPMWNEIHHYDMDYKVIPKTSLMVWHPDLAKNPLKGIGLIPYGLSGVIGLLMSVKGTAIAKDLAASTFLQRELNDGRLDPISRDFAEITMTAAEAGTLAEISVRGLRADRVAGGILHRNEYKIMGRYVKLLENMCENLRIEFKQIVKRVDSSKSGSVAVTNQDGTVFKGRSVICTVPIGILKNNDIEFVPELPYRKQQAIQAVGVGNHIKVALEFTDRFWPAEVPLISNMGVAVRQAVFGVINPFFFDPSKPPVLNILIMGDPSKALLTKNDTEVIQAVCHDLDLMFATQLAGRSSYGLLKTKSDGSRNYAMKRWLREPFFKGSGSFLAYSENPAMPVEMIRPALADSSQTPNLFWAGEATALDSQPQLHGAYMSGRRAAREAIAAVKRNT